MKAPNKLYIEERLISKIVDLPINGPTINYIREEYLIDFLEAVKAGKDDVLLSVNSLINHIKYNVP